MLPFEFIVQGPPVSAQTKNRRRLQSWKTTVARAARQALVGHPPPTSDNVSVTITYYFDESAPDADNIIKPIQDSLNGIIYLDDVQVMETKSLKMDLNGAYRIRGASPVIVQGFIDGNDFLHIKVKKFQPSQELN